MYWDSELIWAPVPFKTKYFIEPELSESLVPPYIMPPTSASALTPALVVASPQMVKPPQSPGPGFADEITTGLLAVPWISISPPFKTAI